MDLSEKLQRIEALQENNKLHGLLLNVLPKLPHVGGVFPVRSAAQEPIDYLIEIKNPATQRASYFGVWATCEKFSSTNAEVIVERLEAAAKYKHRLDDAIINCSGYWFFLAGGISERAKSKVNARLQGRGLDIFEQVDIVRFVDSYTPYFWSDMPGVLGAYLQGLMTKLETLDASTQVVTVATSGDNYIELDTYEKITKTYSNSQHGKPTVKNIDFRKEIPSVSLAILEAEMGFGKSRLMRRCAMQLCSSQSFTETRLLPIFSTYRTFLDVYDGQIESLISGELKEARGAAQEGSAQIVIFLDGIDECSRPQVTTQDLFDQLREQFKNHADIKIIVSTRPLKSLLDKCTLYSDTRIFGIRPLSLSKMVGYLEKACTSANLPNRLFEDLKRSQLFKQLPQSPIAAALFSNLLAQNQQEVPQSLTELYAKSMDLMLGRWDQKKEIGTEKQFKTAQLIAEMIAEYYVQNKLIYVALKEVESIIREYLQKRNTGVSFDDVVKILMVRSTVFSVDHDHGTVAFRHRSFAEFLCANRLAKSRKLKVSETALDPYWVNVFYFYVGTIADCPEVLEELKSVVARNENEEWMRLISVPSYLLAAYQTEFENVKSNVAHALIDAARLYRKVKSGETSTRLSSLSEMHLLFLFKSIVNETLGYDFFAAGAEDIDLLIQTSEHEDEVVNYARFFLACFQSHCGQDGIFRELVNNVGVAKLPMPISLAINCELSSSTNVETGKLLKFHRSKLDKLLRSGGGKSARAEELAKRSQVSELFDRPVSAKRKVLS